MIIDISKIAFVIAHRDREKSLHYMLHSLYRSYRASEITLLFVDDNNRYDSEKFISSFTTNYIYLKNNKRQGADISKSIGIKEAMKRGYEYIIILDDDLIFDKNWLNATIALYNASDFCKDNVITSFVTAYYKYDKSQKIKTMDYKAYLLDMELTPMSVGNLWNIDTADKYYNAMQSKNQGREFVVEHLFREDMKSGKLRFFIKEGKSMVGHFGKHSVRVKYDQDTHPNWGDTALGFWLPCCSSDIKKQLDLIPNINEWGKE